MGDWNFDISQAPLGEFVSTTRTVKGKEVVSRDYRHDKIIAATDCGNVIITWWLPQIGQDGGRWNFFCKGQVPVAWMPYPKHPNVREAA
nr:hypothetical protein [Brucella intermedia]